MSGLVAMVQRHGQLRMMRTAQGRGPAPSCLPLEDGASERGGVQVQLTTSRRQEKMSINGALSSRRWKRAVCSMKSVSMGVLPVSTVLYVVSAASVGAETRVRVPVAAEAQGRRPVAAGSEVTKSCSLN
jgi:hypothetical protein